jgi:cytidine deaminase
MQQQQASSLPLNEEAHNSASQLTEKDFELIEEAKCVSRRLHKPHYHVVVSALRTSTPSDKIYTGIHIESSQPLCGEVSAVCSMINDGRQMGELETIVALAGDDTDKDKFRIFSPCGRCRELIGDCNRNARVIVGTMEQPYVLNISTLMPLKSIDIENEYWARQTKSEQ